MTGLTVATEMLLRQLDRQGIGHAVVDISREIGRGNPVAKVSQRALALLGMPDSMRRLAADLKKSAPTTLFYLQLGQSTRAMLRDLVLMRTARALGLPVIVHLHGSMFRLAYDRAPRAVRSLMARALGQVARAIVLSDSLAGISTG